MRALVCLMILVSATPALAQGEAAHKRDEYRQYALSHAGDAARGEKLFTSHQQLACANCHSLTGLEKAGPFLDGIADKYPRAELIKHILEPSLFIQPGYELVTIATKQGRVYSGRIRLVNLEEYRLLDAANKLIKIPQADIEERKASLTSMMPDNTVSVITPAEFADLIAYLETLRAAPQKGLLAKDQPIDIPKLPRSIEFHLIHPPEGKFANPVDFKFIPGQPQQWAVVEQQSGLVWRMDRSVTPPARSVFLDLKSEITISSNQGILCIAFHPRYAENGRYFLKHQVTEEGKVKSIIVERLAAADRLRDSGQPSIRLLEVDQPAFNHNGGCIDFGPDGMLYTAYGDGGPQRDPNGYSQNPRSLHGSMLRIDVDHHDPGRTYAIPPDNPWVTASREDSAIRGETWAIGLREPWRFSFDSKAGDLWVGDVGQDKFEEILILHRGENHGWNVYEGFNEFSSQYRRPGEPYVFPLFAYPRSLGVSVTGGFVYRGKKSPTFDGVYIFADYESRRFWGLSQENNRVTSIRELGTSAEHPVSFGVDESGELYFATYEGNLFAIDLAGTKYE